VTSDGAAGATVSIRIDALDPHAAARWRTVARLARELPADGSGAWSAG
jgi:hypothetical protein